MWDPNKYFLRSLNGYSQTGVEKQLANQIMQLLFKALTMNNLERQPRKKIKRKNLKTALLTERSAPNVG